MTMAETVAEEVGACGLVLYELAGADPALRFSPHCWKTRMALAHKGLEAERLPWRFTEKDRIAFSGQGLVPVLVDRGRTVVDSWAIACHLEAAYPDRPALFGDAQAQALAGFVNDWADTALLPALARLLVLDIHGAVDERDRDYFRRSRETRFGAALEEIAADPPALLADLDRVLLPLRRRLKGRNFLAGETPAYADYCVFGLFMWARCVGSTEVLNAADPVFAWHQRLLDAFGGLARAAPRRHA